MRSKLLSVTQRRCAVQRVQSNGPNVPGDRCPGAVSTGRRDLAHEFAEFAGDLVTGVEHDRISDRGIGIEQFRTHVALTIQLGVGVEVAPIRRLLDVAEIVQIARGSSIRNTMLSVR
jgi:hypothetical protein